ncbi:MAG: ribonucleotide reductase N-terminal alpha domain-containing protein [Methanogenium sp.]|jgi:ribonucleoside-diphosphate reductase alpha chain
MFTKQEVYEETLKYFNGDSMLTSIWVDKYALKDNDKYLEKTPQDMHVRLAKEFARIELKYPNPLSYEEIYSLLEDFKYIIPGGSILYGLGNNYSISSIGNCFVVGNRADSIGSIFNTGEEQAQLMKRRCGVGHDLSIYRPHGHSVSNSARTSTGVETWEDFFSNITRNIAQDGRRGALMLSLDINHPDIERFIKSKDDLTKVTGANISIKITDEFMKAVENDEDYGLHFPTEYLDETNVFNTIGIKAKELWNLIIHQATTKAEPGVLFIDTITRESIPACYGEEWKETSTNP